MSTRTSSCVAGSTSDSQWPLERVLFAIAGTVVLIAVVLSLLVSEWFVLLAAFVGINQWLFVLVGACPMSLFLTRVLGLRKATA